jgi:hypothetical protein
MSSATSASESSVTLNELRRGNRGGPPTAEASPPLPMVVFGAVCFVLSARGGKFRGSEVGGAWITVARGV